MTSVVMAGVLLAAGPFRETRQRTRQVLSVEGTMSCL